MQESLPEYAFEIVADVVMGICLGILVNNVADIVAKCIGLSFLRQINHSINVYQLLYYTS